MMNLRQLMHPCVILFPYHISYLSKSKLWLFLHNIEKNFLFFHFVNMRIGLFDCYPWLTTLIVIHDNIPCGVWLTIWRLYHLSRNGLYLLFLSAVCQIDVEKNNIIYINRIMQKLGHFRVLEIRGKQLCAL